MKRYENLNKFLLKVLGNRPAKSRIRILEIGTWRGIRAVELSRFVEARGFQCSYRGVDLFEDLTDELKITEFCGKPKPPSMSEVLAKLRREIPNTTVNLYKGESREALWKILDDLATGDSAVKTIQSIDFIFIDGGHSHDTILSDFNLSWGMLADDGYIIMDDYYMEREDVGCRGVVEEIREGKNVEILDPGDFDPNTGLTIRVVAVSKCPS